MYQNKLLIKAEKRPLDEILVYLANYCAFNIQLYGEKWPVTSLVLKADSCQQLISHIAHRFQLTNKRTKTGYEINIDTDNFSVYKTKIDANRLIQLLSKDFIKRFKIFVISSRQLAYTDTSNRIIRYLNMMDKPTKHYDLSFVLWISDIDKIEGYQNSIGKLYEEINRKNGFNRTIITVLGDFINAFRNKVSANAYVAVSPFFKTTLPGDLKWSNSLIIPAHENIKKKIQADFSLTCQFNQIMSDELLLRLKLKFNFPQIQKDQVASKSNQLDLSVPISLDKVNLLYSFYLNYDSSSNTPKKKRGLFKIFSFIAGNRHVNSKMWVSLWLIINETK